jgi:dienelactone hydrolase
MKDHITVEGRDGTFDSYIARPNTLPAAAVVVLHEVFGVNADIRKHCDELAEQGFIAVAPDLFWRQEPGVDLSVSSEPDWQHGLRLYQAYDRNAGADRASAVAVFFYQVIKSLRVACCGNESIAGFEYGLRNVSAQTARAAGD